MYKVVDKVANDLYTWIKTSKTKAKAMKSDKLAAKFPRLKFLSITEGTPAQIEWANKLATGFLKYETRRLTDEELATIFSSFGNDALFWINNRTTAKGSMGLTIAIMRNLGYDDNFSKVA